MYQFFNIIRTLFNFQEKKWIKYIRNNLHSEKVETDLKVYIQPNVFSGWFEDKKKDRPYNIRDGIAALNFSANELANKDIFMRPEVPSKSKKKAETDEDEESRDDFVRVRLLFHTKLKVFEKKIDEICKESLATQRAKTILSKKERAQFGSPTKGQFYLDEYSSLIKANGPDAGTNSPNGSPFFDQESAFRKHYWADKSRRKLDLQTT